MTGLPPDVQREELVETTTTVNGELVTVAVPPRLHVADFLRQQLGLTGTHVGCEQGACGMCTVVVDGEAVKSCLMLACQLDGRNVQTVESLAEDDRLTRCSSASRRHTPCSATSAPRAS